MSRKSALVLALLVVAAVLSLVAFRRGRAEHQRLTAELARIRTQATATQRQQEENARLAELIKAGRQDQFQATAALRAEVEQAQREVAELESKAVAERDMMVEKNRVRTEALHTNRDPTQGPMLIENCADAGRATPAATLQTLIWAAAHGNDELVQSAVVFDPAARALAEAAIAMLPESSRAKYPTPESLAALFLAQVVNDLTGIRVTDQTVTGNEATISVSGLQKPIGKMNLRQTPDGWQVVLNPEVFASIRRMLLTPRK